MLQTPPPAAQSEKAELIRQASRILYDLGFDAEFSRYTALDEVSVTIGRRVSGLDKCTPDELRRFIAAKREKAEKCRHLNLHDFELEKIKRKFNENKQQYERDLTLEMERFNAEQGNADRTSGDGSRIESHADRDAGVQNARRRERTVHRSRWKQG